MLITISDGTGIVPESLQQQFKGLIIENHLNYLGQENLIEKIETDKNLYRIKFDLSIDPSLFLIHILELDEFNK